MSATRDIIIEIRARDRFFNVSGSPARLTVSNPAPDAPTGIVLTSSLKSFMVDWQPSSIPDIAGYLVHASKTPGFSPSESNLIYRGAGTHVIKSAVYGETWYVRVAAYDTFGEDSLNYSGQYSIMVGVQASSDDIADGAITDVKIASMTVAKLTTGTLTSKAITLAVADGDGDAKIQAGKTDFGDTTAGFILGIDDSDPLNLAKFEIGNASSYLKWTGSALQIAGDITATTGHIGGFTIGTTSIQATNLTLDSAGEKITLGSGNDILALDAADPTYRLAIGHATYSSAPFRVTKAGAITATSGTIGGWTLGASTLKSASDSLILDATNKCIYTGDYSSGPLGKGWKISDTLAEFQNITARGTFSSAVFQKGTINAVNGMVLVSGADILASDMTAADASALTIKGNTTFAVNEIIRIKDGTNDEWLQITNTASAPTYTVTRDLAGSYGANANPAWTKGTTVASMGVSGKGFIMLDASSANSPVIQVYKRNSTTYNDYTEYCRLGNLNGFLGYSSELYGIAIGDTNKYLKYDPTNGLQIAGGIYVSAGSGKRIEINPSSDNELHFYGDRGDTTVEQIATLGISAFGSDYIIGQFGSTNTTHIPVWTIGKKWGLWASIYGSTHTGAQTPLKIDNYPNASSGVNVLYGASITVLRNHSTYGTADTGTADFLYGVAIRFGNDNSNAISPITTYIYGLSLEPYMATGSCNTLKVLNLETVYGSSTITNYYAIYQQDSAAKNYFAGAFDNITLQSGKAIWLGSGKAAITLTDAATDAITFDNCHVGIGTTPSAWSSGTALDIGTNSLSLWGSGTAAAYLGDNWYYNSGYKYKGTGAAHIIGLDSNGLTYSYASSGTAGNAITFSKRFNTDSTSLRLFRATTSNYNIILLSTLGSPDVDNWGMFTNNATDCDLAFYNYKGGLTAFYLYYNGNNYQGGDAYIVGNCSAQSFTDRTPHYEGDAISELMKIAGKNGEIDHKTLPPFAYVKCKKKIHCKGKDGADVITEQDEEGRDIGAMVSIITAGMQQHQVIIQQQREKISKLEAEIAELRNAT